MFTADLATFLTATGVTVPILSDGEQELVNQLEDEVVLLTLSGGSHELMERTFDTPSVQIMCRGAQNDPASAETLAYQVDEALLGPICPVDIGTRVIAITRTGGPPRFLNYDTARRRVFVCTYLFTAARTSF